MRAKCGGRRTLSCFLVGRKVVIPGRVAAVVVRFAEMAETWRVGAFVICGGGGENRDQTNG